MPALLQALLWYLAMCGAGVLVFVVILRVSDARTRIAKIRREFDIRG